MKVIFRSPADVLMMSSANRSCANPVDTMAPAIARANMRCLSIVFSTLNCLFKARQDVMSESKAYISSLQEELHSVCWPGPEPAIRQLPD
ncbi:hypothetical protein ES708_24709 [subsurface metagenome]